MRRISFEVPDDLGKRIKIRAINEGLTLADLAKQIFLDYLRKKEWEEMKADEVRVQSKEKADAPTK